MGALSATPARRRAPLMALAVAALLAGLWGGLQRLGVSVASTPGGLGEAHGPLMALGFLGTLISLERAVALGRPWAYAAPLAAGVGAVWVLTGLPGGLGVVLLTVAALVLVAAFVALHRLQASLHNAIMGLGAVSWSVAGVAWLLGLDVRGLAPLLVGFLVLTIVGERLELSRTLRLSRSARGLLLAAVSVFAAGLGLSLIAQDAGVRLAGIGLLGQALWLARHDVARRTARRVGVTRFKALALLAGYLWLAVTGALWTLSGLGQGLTYDAMLHAAFLGFVMSMVFAHAPVIVPAVLRVALPFHPAFYGHLALLHASLALRLLGGDLAGNVTLWRWGGVLNEVAILLFIAVTVTAILRARHVPTRAPAGTVFTGSWPPAGGTGAAAHRASAPMTTSGGPTPPPVTSSNRRSP